MRPDPLHDDAPGTVQGSRGGVRSTTAVQHIQVPRLGRRCTLLLGLVLTYQEHRRDLPNHLGKLAGLLGISRRCASKWREELVEGLGFVKLAGGFLMSDRAWEFCRDSHGIRSDPLPASLMHRRNWTPAQKCAAAVLNGETIGPRSDCRYVRTDAERAEKSGTSRQVVRAARHKLQEIGLAEVERVQRGRTRLSRVKFAGARKRRRYFIDADKADRLAARASLGRQRGVEQTVLSGVEQTDLPHIAPTGDHPHSAGPTAAKLQNQRDEVPSGTSGMIRRAPTEIEGRGPKTELVETLLQPDLLSHSLPPGSEVSFGPKVLPRDRAARARMLAKHRNLDSYLAQVKSEVRTVLARDGEQLIAADAEVHGEIARIAKAADGAPAISRKGMQARSDMGKVLRLQQEAMASLLEVAGVFDLMNDGRRRMKLLDVAGGLQVKHCGIEDLVGVLGYAVRKARDPGAFVAKWAHNVVRGDTTEFKRLEARKELKRLAKPQVASVSHPRDPGLPAPSDRRVLG